MKDLKKDAVEIAERMSVMEILRRTGKEQGLAEIVRYAKQSNDEQFTLVWMAFAYGHAIGTHEARMKNR